MSGNKRAKQRVLISFSLTVLGLALLWALMTSLVLAQGPIILDGVAGSGEWDPGWQVATDPLDVDITGVFTHPNAAPNYARSGYDAIGLWAHYDTVGETWYFRLDVDGVVGDSDSMTGTPGNLGVGTHGPDGGPLGGDSNGIGPPEAYRLRFRYGSSGSYDVQAELGYDSNILPGVVTTTTGLAGWGVYSTTVPGILEWAFDRETIFPTATASAQLWAWGQMGDNSDSVSDDSITPTLLIALDQVAQCPATSIVIGDEATFPLDYAIPASATLGVNDVMLAADVPTGTTFLSASAGGIESGGVVTWSLGNLSPGDAGQVTMTLRVDDPLLTSLTINSEMTCAEGLRYQFTSPPCLLLQPTPTPTSTPTPTPGPTPTRPVTPLGPPGEIPEPATVNLLLSGLVGLASYAALRWRARRRIK